MSPGEWIVLDNLRCGYPIDTNLPVGMALEAIQRCKDKEFVHLITDEKVGRYRLTHKGEIALRLSLIEKPKETKNDFE